MKKFTKLLSLIPLCVMLYIIFMFSAQDGNESGSLSYKVCEFVVGVSNELLSLELPEERFTTIAESLQFFIRKCAHMTEYFILALTIFLPLRVLLRTDAPLIFGKSPKKRGKLTQPEALAQTTILEKNNADISQNASNPTASQKNNSPTSESRTAWAACLREKLWMTLFFGVLFASLDEFHQTFVPGRAGLPTDVMIDSIGICAACLLLWFCYRTSFLRRITFGG